MVERIVILVNHKAPKWDYTHGYAGQIYSPANFQSR